MTGGQMNVYRAEQDWRNARAFYNFAAPAARTGWLRYNWWAYLLLLVTASGTAALWLLTQEPAGPALIGGLATLTAGYITYCVNTHWVDAHANIDELARNVDDAEAGLEQARTAAAAADHESAARRQDAAEVADDLIAWAATTWTEEKTAKLARVLTALVEPIS